MSIIVEDGTGLMNANSYVSVEYADDYFAMRGKPDLERTGAKPIRNSPW
ncbi:hypothetical protein [Stenotrophomonas phage CM2]